MKKENKLKKFFNSKGGSWFIIVFGVLLSTVAQFYSYYYVCLYDGHKCDFYYAFTLFLVYATVDFTIWTVREIVRHVKKYGKRQTESKD